MTSYKKLLMTALPATLAVLMGPIAATVDTIVIGQRDGDWLGPFAAGNAVMNSFYHSLNFLVYAVSARVAQAYGQKDGELLRRETITGLSLALMLGLASFAILAIFKPQFLGVLMGLSGTPYHQAAEYFDARLPGVPFMLVSSAAIGILRGYQQMSATVVMVAASTLINAGLSYACLFWWGTGLWGAGFGTTVSFVASVAIGWYYISGQSQTNRQVRHSQPLRLRDTLPTRNSRKLIDWRSFSGDAKYQLIRSFTLNGTLMGMTAICSHASTTAVAGTQIIYQVMVVVACLLSGLAVSVSALGGEAIGQNNYSGWWQLCNRSLVMTVVISLAVAALLALLEQPLLIMFTGDAALRASTLPTLRLYIAMVPLFGLLYQMEGILYSAKMFKYVAMSLILSGTLLFVPALLIAQQLGFSTLWSVWFAFGMLNTGRLLVNGYNYWRAWQKDFRLVKAYRL